MSKEYRSFITHAKKLTRRAPEDRQILKGVLHREDGSLVVTDSHRMYMLHEAYEGDTKVLDPNTNMKIEGNYPEVDRLLPRNNPIFSEIISVDEWVKIIDLFVVAEKLAGGQTGTSLLENRLECLFAKEIEASYDLGGIIPPVDFEILFTAIYFKEALQMFKAIKIREVRFNIYKPVYPFTLTSLDGRALALSMPRRRI